MPSAGLGWPAPKILANRIIATVHWGLNYIRHLCVHFISSVAVERRYILTMPSLFRGDSRTCQWLVGVSNLQPGLSDTQFCGSATRLRKLGLLTWAGKSLNNLWVWPGSQGPTLPRELRARSRCHPTPNWCWANPGFCLLFLTERAKLLKFQSQTQIMRECSILQTSPMRVGIRGLEGDNTRESHRGTVTSTSQDLSPGTVGWHFLWPPVFSAPRS